MPASASSSSASSSSAGAPGRTGNAISIVRVWPFTLNVTDWRSQSNRLAFSSCIFSNEGNV